MISDDQAAEGHFAAIEDSAKAEVDNTTWSGNSENCDVCSRPMASETYMIDGPCQTGNRPMWANLCVVCAHKTSPTIGWGKAQLYKRDGDVWRLVAGGPQLTSTVISKF